MKLKSGGILYEEVYNSKKREYDLIDITSKAYAYLYEIVELENVTVRDIYSLIAKHGCIQQILSRNYIEEFLAHIATNPQKEITKSENPDTEMEYIEIYRNGYYDRELNRLDFYNVPGIHGCSYVLKEDYENYKAGKRINWSLSFTPIANILDLPIKVNTMVECQHDNYISVCDFNTIVKFERRSYTLLDILNAVTWELSFHGSPQETESAGENFKNLVDEVQEEIDRIENGEDNDEEDSNFIAIDDLLSPDNFINGFSFIDPSIDKKKLNQLIRYLPNKVDIALFFGTAFPKKIMVKEIYAGITAYEYRHRMYGADESWLISKEMKEIISKNEGIRNNQPSIIVNKFLETLEFLGASITVEQIHEMEIF